jgi:hypothetical protein
MVQNKASSGCLQFEFYKQSIFKSAMLRSSSLKGKIHGKLDKINAHLI